MTLVALLFAVLPLALFRGLANEPLATLTPLERLQAKVPVESVVPGDVPILAGYYKNPSGELIKNIGGALSGDELYLFPDRTYIYCEWADIQPLTIYDKGQWTFENGAVELKSDPDVTWDPVADRAYVAVRRRSKKNEILLVGVHSDLSRFEAETQDNSELTLLYIVKKRESTIARPKIARVKARLLRESWHPELFKAKPTD